MYRRVPATNPYANLVIVSANHSNDESGVYHDDSKVFVGWSNISIWYRRWSRDYEHIDSSITLCAINLTLWTSKGVIILYTYTLLRHISCSNRCMNRKTSKKSFESMGGPRIIWAGFYRERVYFVEPIRVRQFSAESPQIRLVSITTFPRVLNRGYAKGHVTGDGGM